MPANPRILAVDDDTRFLSALGVSLSNEGFDFVTATRGTEAMRSMSEMLPDLVLLDFCLPEMSGLELLKIFKRRYPETFVLMLTGERDADTIIETMKNGAADFVIKGSEDFEANLKFRIAQALERSALQRKNRELLTENLTRSEQNRKLSVKIASHSKSYTILGVSTPTLKMKGDIHSLKGIRSTVLITGENGTGKELVARALNTQEEDFSRPFIDVNCAAISPGLFESEFFGHVKGAFTGATDNRDGKFKLAHGGDIFLDEIGEIPIEMQAKLLRVLQEKTFVPVGSTKTISVEVRVIAATNRNLEDDIRRGRFREDLYYRLNPIRIEVPALRERREDIAFLAEEFLKRLLPMGKLTEPAKKKLLGHSWPGNIRELHNVIERAVVVGRTSGRPTIKPEHILLTRTEPHSVTLSIPEDLLPRAVSDIDAARFKHCLNWMERQYLFRGLNAMNGDNEALYRKLGFSRAYYFKRKKLVGVPSNRKGEDSSA